ncbi:Mitogen-activated protein kinase kinase 5 [Vitis vinifera]|uniref:Mitogen-activated protein kinase kinase 5 n=1 Tax=Vitis vinifera TaxID=29760 RepID=A0A438IFF6_VITVI|nr:Mitogen-activated protein kinase kinase 5 [Vitis vinifera]
MTLWFPLPSLPRNCTPRHQTLKPPNQLQATSEDRRLWSDRILAETIDLCNSLVGTIVFMSPDRINTNLNHNKYKGCVGDI